MRFIEKWSYICAYQLSSSMDESHQKRTVYYYGFYIAIGALVKGVSLFLPAALLGIFIPTLLVVFTFGSLRTFAGGYHMDTYNRCLLVSMGMFLTAGLIIRYTYAFWSIYTLGLLAMITFIAALYILIKYAPKDTPNKPITDPQQIRKFKILSISYIFIWGFITFVFIKYKMNMAAISLCSGVLLELFAITPTGHKFFDAVKALFNLRKHRSAKTA